MSRTDVPPLGPVQLPHINALVRIQRGEYAEWKDLAKQHHAALRKGENLSNSAKAPIGAPTIRHRSPNDAKLAAWLTDGLGYSSTRVAVYLGLGGKNERSTRTTARRYIAAGRKMLNDWGCLPWTLWADGQAPNHWWTTREFEVGINLWADLVESRKETLKEFSESFAHKMKAIRTFPKRNP